MATVTKKVPKKATPKAGGKKVTSKVTKVTKAIDKKNVKDTLKKVVKSNREIKYNYPRAIKTPGERKSWRQKVRNKLHRLELKAAKATGSNKAKTKEALGTYRKEVLLVPQ